MSTQYMTAGPVFRLTYVKLVPNHDLVNLGLDSKAKHNLPIIVNGLDDKSECWRYAVDVLAHNTLDDRCFAAIIKPPAQL